VSISVLSRHCLSVWGRIQAGTPGLMRVEAFQISTSTYHPEELEIAFGKRSRRSRMAPILFPVSYFLR